MKIFNTLSGKKEKFTPIDPNNVKLYACGPTVYDRPHLGNARAAVVYDILYRLLRAIYPNVLYARNITDVDDKIIAAAESSGVEIAEITKKMTQYYHDDINALNCLSPTYEPKATQHIEDMILMISELIDLNHAYVAQGHVLFDVTSYKEYGMLAKRNMEEMIAGARVEVAPYKKNPADFVLWKPAKEHAFSSPWGDGRPGWHIECSAMSKAFLGKTFDIHGGGADLKFPHHENEIAQSTCANNTTFANYWVHNGFLTIDGEKMSKSLKNFTTVRELLDRGTEGVVIRYFYLTSHYKKPIDFNQKAIDDAKRSISKFKEALSAGEIKHGDNVVLDDLKNDMNTPAALSKLHQLADLAIQGDVEARSNLAASLEFLGLNIKAEVIPHEIEEIAKQRHEHKKNKNWAESDKLRDLLTQKGFMVKDTADGYKIIKL